MTAVAGKSVNGYCNTFCISDFRNKATIETREISQQKFGETYPEETFTVLFTGYFRVQTVEGTARFAGVNIDKEATHLFVARWRATINNLDGAGAYFMRSKGRLYRVLKITNVDEQDDFILFQCTERGIDTKQETNA